MGAGVLISNSFWRRGCALLVLLTLVLVATPTAARTKSLDLRKHPDLRIVGPEPGGLPGVDSHPGAEGPMPTGDINGDGERDIVVASNRADSNGRLNSGSVYVIFGPFTDGEINVEILVGRGYRIDGASTGDHAGFAVAVLGDVNGDHLDDILVGAPNSANAIRSWAGRAYVIFGKASTESVDLLSFDNGSHADQGFVIDGGHEEDSLGIDLDDIGDMNGDGLADMIINSYGSSAYVVFGKAGTAPIDLKDFDDDEQGSQGFRIYRPNHMEIDSEDYVVAGIGDVNGDGTPDVYVQTCWRTTDKDGCWKRKGLVIFGKKSSVSIRANKLGNRGFMIDWLWHLSGLSLRPGGSGDLNDDGKADLIAIYSSSSDKYEAVLLFGKDDSEKINPYEVGRHGYRIKPWLDKEGYGPFPLGLIDRVAAAGDLDKDGTPDMLISAPTADPRGRNDAGCIFVVYGRRRDGSAFKLRDLGRHGYRIDGPEADELLGLDLSGSKDLNGDYRPDILADGRHGSSRIHVSWGRHL
jgi:hypothetical protein